MVNLLLSQFHHIKRKEEEPINEFNARFDALIKYFPENLRPKDEAILLCYKHAFEGQFGIILRDKSPKTLLEAQEWASEIETNLIASKLNDCPTKQVMKILLVLEQRLEQIKQAQEMLMNKIDALGKEYNHLQT
jgi:hypothetical protein